MVDEEGRGAAWCLAHSERVDGWLTGIFADAVGAADHQGIALVAVGGYGRSELCPQSDIDVMLVHDGRRQVAELADRVWYPIWDEGLHLGHSVCTVKEAIEIARETLDTATALLSARHVTGDPRLSAQMAKAGRDHWEKYAKRVLTELGTRVELRHETAGEVAFRLEPDLKEGRGGLRDVHALHWVEAARSVMLDHDAATLGQAYAALLDVRVELQLLTGRPSNVLSLQDQEAVAGALGLDDADALMHRVAEAARTIAWTSDDSWRRIRSSLRGPLGRVGRRRRPLEHGLVLHDGDVALEPGADPSRPLLLLQAARAAAVHHTVVERDSLKRLATAAPPLPDPWPAEARALFVELLLAGRWATNVIEALDQRGAWADLFPEWSVIRAKPQRDPYHRFTVDRHLLEATANAARLAERVERPDLLVVGALLHDIGKGRGGDHTEVGVVLADRIAKRMGFDAEDVATLAWLVEQHLLLPDVAMRRDLEDATTIRRVAEVVGTPLRLELLAALTEADSLATGPSAWGPTKARLVGELVDRTRFALTGDAEAAPAPVKTFPSPDHLAVLVGEGTHVAAADDVVTVVTDDRPGTFSRIAGVLALHGLDVVSAAAHSTDTGRALSEFRVVDSMRRETPWDRVVADLHLALGGRLALPARLAERARTYGRQQPATAPAAAIEVRFDNEASEEATVVEVQAPDAHGALYRITRALADLDLDIRSAHIQTLGHLVIDAFYVRSRTGDKIDDPALRGEIERALVHGLAE